MASSAKSLWAGVSELLILRTLEDRPMYGYELAREVRERTGERITLGEGLLYPTLHSLEGRGFLGARRKTVGGRTRVYYRLTRKGQRRLATLTKDFERISEAVHSVLGGGHDAAPAV